MNDLSFYRNKRVLITGHTGFKGAWLSCLLVHAGAQVTGYALSPNTQPNLWELIGPEKVMRSIIGDVRDIDALMHAFDEAKPEIVLHLAAQPLVRESYRTPLYTYETNVMGTVHMLECVRTHSCVRSFINVTTDKVYLNNEGQRGFREDDPLDGFDPYSNSKSCSELVTHSYKRSFFADGSCAISTVRAGNVIGGGDFSRDRIMPDCVDAAENGKPISVRNPASIRPYQHVLEPLFVYVMIAQRQYEDAQYAGWYNVGPDDCDCVTTGDLANLFCEVWGEGAAWESHAQPGAPHEAGCLKLDCTKLKETFGWQPRWRIRQAVEKTVEWSKARRDGKSVRDVTASQIRDFFEASAII